MADDNKAAEAVRPNDKVAPVKDGGDSGHASSEAVALLDRKTPAAGAGVESPIKDGSMGTTPPASDKTMTTYWAAGNKIGADGATAAATTDASAKTRDGSDKSDPANHKLEDATKAYMQTLERAHMPHEQAQEFARSTADRLQKAADSGKLVGSPEEQINRMNKSMTDVLDKTGVKDGKLENGQLDRLNPADRDNIVKDMAARQANPDKYVNQGDHMTCVLQSNQKQRLEAGDPAKVSEQISSVVNKGSAEIVQKDGTTRTVNVDSRSFAHDGESGQEFSASKHGEQGKRGMAGHVYDALAGQTVADLRAEREHLPTSAKGIGGAAYVYAAAHADDFGAKPGQTSTNEALMARGKDGSLSFVTNSPGADIWQAAHLNMAMGGDKGAMFAAASVVGDGVAPKNRNFPDDMRVTSFSDTKELHSKLSEFQNRTGQSAQILVDAPYLPGGGQSGHGLHAMNIKALENGKFKLDNNWASNYDVGSVDASVVARATNPEGSVVPSDRPRPDSGPVDPRHPDLPSHDTEIKPGSGRNPNESIDQWNQRLEEQKKLDEAKQKELLEKQSKDREKAEAHAAWNQAKMEAKLRGEKFSIPEP